MDPIRAWHDIDYRQSLSAATRPAHPRENSSVPRKRSVPS
jgi:mersacidin/lichenicidin family type 2 lantibiotic